MTKKREIFCACWVFVQPDALAHSGANSRSDALTHTGTDGGAQHGHTKVIQFADALCDLSVWCYVERTI